MFPERSCWQAPRKSVPAPAPASGEDEAHLAQGFPGVHITRLAFKAYNSKSPYAPSLLLDLSTKGIHPENIKIAVHMWSLLSQDSKFKLSEAGFESLPISYSSIFVDELFSDLFLIFFL